MKKCQLRFQLKEVFLGRSSGLESGAESRSNLLIATMVLASGTVE